jgi:hypothetical protein
MRPIYMITSKTPAGLFQRATEICPRGYDFVNPPQVTADHRQVATIECR